MSALLSLMLSPTDHCPPNSLAQKPLERSASSYESVSATYTVKADCTGTVTYRDGSQIDVFIAPDGSKFTFVQTKPSKLVGSGFEPRGTAKRVGD